MSSRDVARVRRLSVLAVAACLFTGASSAGEPADEKQKLGYSVGYQVGSDFRRQRIAIDPEMVVRGVRDALAGTEPALPPEEMRAALTEVRRQAATAAREQREEQARSNLEAGRSFLARDREREGVTALASGLQYEILEAGSGPTPMRRLASPSTTAGPSWTAPSSTAPTAAASRRPSVSTT